MATIDDTVPNDTDDVGTYLEDKYLTFKLSDEEYGIQILTVQRIIQMQQITPVPKTPEYVRGVINLRGAIIPVLDLRNKFGMSPCEDSNTSCIIVIQVMVDFKMLTMGVVIDAVSEVLFISADMIQETPSFGNDVENEFIIGIAKVRERVIMLVELNSLLSKSEIGDLATMQSKT
ncbi:MAG: chemotaxis protein CheW [Fibrobacterales bacterium]